MNPLKVRIGGMHCASCVERVERALKSVPGVEQVEIQLLNGTGALDLKNPPDWERMSAALKDAGYSIEPWAQADASHAAVSPASADWDSRVLPAVASLALGSALMLFGHDFMMRAGVPISLGVQALWGGPFHAGLWRWLRGKGASMETLVGLGSLAALGLSLASSDHPYFEVNVFLIGFVRLGKWLESRAKRRTGSAVRRLVSLAPPQALKVLPDGSAHPADAGLLNPGDRVRIAPGERIPADGTVVLGHSAVDESWLTGESLPVEKTLASKLLAGSRNGMGLLEMTVNAAPAQSLLHQIIERVERAQMSRAPIQRVADQVAARFVPFVLVAGLLTFGAWILAGGSLETAVLHAVSVLVIACPCALGLATPAALVVGLGRASEHSILFKNGAALETLARSKTFVFDKTGTLTLGKPRLRQQLTLSSRKDSKEWLALAASAELGSEHPLAQAFASAARAQGMKPQPPEKFQAVPGQGIRASLRGEFVLMGTLRFFKEQGIPLPENAATWIEAQAREGATSVCLAHDFELVAIFAFEDAPRDDAPTLIHWLTGRGLMPHLLSGDRTESARAMGTRLGFAASRIDGEVLPHQKEARIAILESRAGPVAMIGDGINDAPALARASVSVSLMGSSETALDSAQVILMSGKISDLKLALEISNATLRTIRQNLAASAIYNVLGIPIAAGVFERSLGLSLSPSWAGAAMALSSVSVVLNSLRLRGSRAIE